VDPYLTAAGIGDAGKSSLFRTIDRRRALTDRTNDEITLDEIERITI
jgi:hypothetical protein